MIPQDFRDYFESLTAASKDLVVEQLLQLSMADKGFEDIGESKPPSCPHCNSEHLKGNGYLKSMRRYACKDCGKYFSKSTGKVWFRIKKKAAWQKYVYCLLSGYSIRRCATECGISVNTSFNWRHKLLASFGDVSPTQFEGIVESDEMFFRESQKGDRQLLRAARKRGSKASKRGVSDEQVAVLGTCDRHGNKDLQVVKKGRISQSDIEEAIGQKLQRAVVLCSDSHPSFVAFAKSQDMVHKKHNASKGERVIEKVYHVQNVNNMHKSVRQFIDQFNGVSSKYLQNYLNWYMALEKVKNTTNRISALAAIAFSSQNALEVYSKLASNAFN